MSWSHTVIVEIEKTFDEIKTELEGLFDPQAIIASQANATETQVNAAKTAAAALASAIKVPPGHSLSVGVSGHSQTPGDGSMPDALTVSVCAVPK